MNDRDGCGCGAVLIVLLVLAAIIWVFSSVGHFLGLTPTFSEVTDRPDGWVGRHYRGVFWGYVLTIVLIAVAAGLVWIAAWTQSADQEAAGHARYWLPRAGVAGLVLLVVAIALPIGQRPGVETAGGAAGSAGEGNVPDVVGMNAAEAKKALDAASLTPDFGAALPVFDEQCRVVDQTPKAGSELDEYGTVELRCVVGLPELVGKKADIAETRLRDLGFGSQLVNEPADYDLSRCRVRDQRPTGQAAPYTDVRLKLKCAKPPPEPEPEPLPDLGPVPEPDTEPEPADDCDPNYSGGCVPPYPPDVDCPDVEGSVEVTGEDVHALDREGDGSACE